MKRKFSMLLAAALLLTGTVMLASCKDDDDDKKGKDDKNYVQMMTFEQEVSLYHMDEASAKKFITDKGFKFYANDEDAGSVLYYYIGKNSSGDSVIAAYSVQTGKINGVATMMFVNKTTDMKTQYLNASNQVDKWMSEHNSMFGSLQLVYEGSIFESIYNYDLFENHSQFIQAFNALQLPITSMISEMYTPDTEEEEDDFKSTESQTEVNLMLIPAEEMEDEDESPLVIPQCDYVISLAIDTEIEENEVAKLPRLIRKRK
ncbi:MAG: hypothetical protein IJ250_06085 [Bacteroidales bacterium]|nr:hypothetical protein [Bacteroidales bacterium]